MGQASGWVTFADHPPAFAVPNEIVTPVVMRMFNAVTSVVYAELS
jgi:5,10-methenyltetrahydromethanopterin hydrogenase